MIGVKEIRKVGVLSTAKLFGVMYLALGFLIGIPIACFALFSGSLIAASGFEQAEALGAGLASGLGGVLIYGICVPFLYGFMGFIAGALIAFLYNVIAGFVGGIEIELAEPEAKY